MAIDVFGFLVEYNSWLLSGLMITIQICLLSMGFGLILGLIGALMKLSKNPILRWPGIVYIEIFRSTPLLVQILFMSFAYPRLVSEIFNQPIVLGTWTNPSSFWDVVIVLSLNTGAYQAEIIRAGITSIPRGQMEAARAVGLTYPQAMRYVILPQAYRVITPPLANEFINLILNSSLVSVVAVKDLTFMGRSLSAQTFRTLDTWFSIGIIYFVLTFSLSRLLQKLEKKYRIPVLGIHGED